MSDSPAPLALEQFVERIPLEALRYWNPIYQEAYAGPREALERWTELHGTD